MSASFEEASYSSNVQHKSGTCDSIAISASSTIDYDESPAGGANPGESNTGPSVPGSAATSPTPGSTLREQAHTHHHQQQQQQYDGAASDGSSENALKDGGAGGGRGGAALQPVGHSSSRELAFWPELMTLTEVLARSRHTAVYTAEYSGQMLALKVS